MAPSCTTRRRLRRAIRRLVGIWRQVLEDGAFTAGESFVTHHRHVADGAFIPMAAAAVGWSMVSWRTPAIQ